MRWVPALRIMPLIAAALIGAAGVVHAAPPWAPPVPSDSTKDWVQLVSGEWLRGEIKFMRNEVFEIDSDKLDVRDFDWVDVAQIRSSRALTYGFTNKRSAVGTAAMRDGVIRVLEGGETREFRKGELLSIVAGGDREIDFWSGHLNVGLSASSGNTDQTDGNAQGLLRRDAATTRFDLRYTGNFGQLGGVENANNQLLSGKLDKFLSRQLFLTPGAFQLYGDRFQNIALRSTVGVGLGYYFVRRSDLEWLAQVGGGYLATEHRSVEPGTDLVDRSGAFTPGISLEWDVVKDFTVDVRYSAIFAVPDLDDWSHHFVTGVSIENLEIVEFNVSLSWDRVAKPTPRDDGTVPNKDDLRTTFGIGVDF